MTSTAVRLHLQGRWQGVHPCGEALENSPFFIWMFPKIGVPQNGWFIMENPINIDDLGVSLFSETSICFGLPVVKKAQIMRRSEEK